ncbi:myelin protein zero-like protein 1 [Lacerta agilis]|uniref:myelin protein zero-like protein 1 n=1 Tax=Lacerta agilis TaxID=80427 RepID=UPI001419A498|nr:myelin protein zero-like protein 1 [Lacerta agilis]
MGGGGTMRGKGGGGRKMAAATVTVAALTAPGGGGCSPRQGAAPLAAWLSSLLLAAALGLSQVSAVEVYTPAELSVENGTETKLPCSFSSSEVISSAATVTWSFQPEGSTTTVSFFYYSHGKSYPGKDTQFKDRSSWAGDLNKKDASISISNMQFRDSGTFICDVKNPPDIVVTTGEITVRVVEKDNLPVVLRLEHAEGQVEQLARRLQSLELSAGAAQRMMEEQVTNLTHRIEALEQVMQHRPMQP